MATKSVHPEVTWAQRSSESDAARNVVYLTLVVPDVADKDMKLDLQPTKLSFSGHSRTKNVDYKVELEFFAEIDTKESKINHTDRDVEMVLRKKELKEEYWPRLLKNSAKMHFLKTDFDKWVDEDEQNETAEEDAGQNFGGMGGMGQGDGGEGGFGGIDFSKLGGGPGGMGGLGAMGGMGGMGGLGGMGGMGGLGGMGGMGGLGDMPDSDDEGADDDEMPGLEGEESKEPASGSSHAAGEKSKIEEVE